MKPKPSKALELRPQGLVLSSADVVCVRLGSRNTLRLKPDVGGVMNPAARGNGEGFTLFPWGKARSTCT